MSPGSGATVPMPVSRAADAADGDATAEGEGLAVGEADGDAVAGDDGTGVAGTAVDRAGPSGGGGVGRRATAAPIATPPTRIPASSPAPMAILPPIQHERTSTIG